jgi:hypothetical protein
MKVGDRVWVVGEESNGLVTRIEKWRGTVDNVEVRVDSDGVEVSCSPSQLEEKRK